EPGWPDHADDADDATLAVAVWRDDGGRARQRKQLVFRADEDAHPFAAFGPAEQIGNAALGFQGVEQRAYALEVFHRAQVFQQIGVPAHDQLAFVARPARPARKARGDDLLREL